MLSNTARESAPRDKMTLIDAAPAPMEPPGFSGDVHTAGFCFKKTNTVQESTEYDYHAIGHI